MRLRATEFPVVFIATAMPTRGCPRPLGLTRRREEPVPDAAAARVNRIEFELAAQAPLRRRSRNRFRLGCMAARARVRTLARLGNDLLASLGTAAREHLLTAGGHACAKTRGALAAELARLISTFHGDRPEAADLSEKRAGRVSSGPAGVNTNPFRKASERLDFAPLFPAHAPTDISYRDRQRSREPLLVESGLWARCVRALEAELPGQQFNTWVRPLQAVESSGALKLLAPNRFAVDWVNANLLSRLGEIVRRFVEGDVPIVTVEVGSRGPEAVPAGTRGSQRRAAGRTQRRHRRRRPAQPGFHVRQLRRRQEQPAREGRGGPGGGKSRAAPTTRCSSTAASASARRT